MTDQRTLHIGTIGKLRFGQDVAEYDERLDSYFLRTGTYWALVHDETDLVIGAKGTGKSAIARFLTRPDADIEQLADVIIMPAFNIRGSILFKRLTNQIDADDEAVYRELFLAYMVGLAGNYIVRTFAEAVSVGSLHNGMRSCGLLVQEPTPHTVWRRVLSRVRPKLETTITISEAETDRSRVARPLDESGTSGGAAEPVTLETLEGLLDLIYEALEQLDLRLWILFDRLDEAFPDRRDIEVSALRGLLRAHLDVCSYGTRMRPKLFLRLDIFDRITQNEGFVNATHLRTTRILWDSDSILHLISLRITAGSDELVDPAVRNMLTTSAGRRKLCRSILPGRIENLDPLVWLLLVTVDATREFNPRNALTLLRSAQIAEIQIAMRDRSPGAAKDADLFLSPRALHVGYKQLSVARLQDTLYAESTIARTYIEKLRGKTVRFTRAKISERLGVDGEELEEVLTVLRYVGFLRNDNGSFIIPPLYRPAFFRSIHGAELRLGAGEASELDGFAEADERDPVARELMDEKSEQDSDPSEQPSIPAPRRRGKRGRPKRGSTGRDELVPSNTPSEISDQQDFAEELGNALGGDVDLRPTSVATAESGDAADPVPRVQRVPLGGPSAGAWAASHARDLGEQGDPVGGFHLLYPHRTSHDGAACVAADLAYLSADATIIGLAKEMLQSGDRQRSWPARARLLVLAIATDDEGLIAALLRATSKRFAQEISIAVVRMVSQVPEEEAEFWHRSLLAVSTPTSPPSALRSMWPLLAASRVMAIGRSSWERGVGDVAADVRALRERIWAGELWHSSVRHVEGFLYAYASGGPTSTVPVLLPYQILSCASVIESAGRLTPALRAGIAKSLGTQLEGTDDRNRERFLEWVQYCPIVLEVELPGPEVRRTAQPGGSTSVRGAAKAPDREICDFVVKVIQDGLFEGASTMLLSQLGSRLLARSPGFNYRALGFASLLELVNAVAEADQRITVGKNDDGHPFAALA
ncbi:OST-HTH/LOTUS domain-containing protein [Micromonospora sp. U56]|uniref:OST-HTH/LOTUS domain-containing protein n=1 Tax=Micromonospora sp. U56 TaxID=2824900 RepID=UPI001B382FEC|nr:OST-HTH/LOTUS domain-containing protein [Micromonospora sp. U56]MBQ0897173.1 OST-HTH/LOTUS domain-containing protein [Micromonospora sp. U56]